MQKATTTPKNTDLIYKPYQSGVAISALAAKRGLRIMAYLVVFTFIYLFLGQFLLFDLLWLRVALNLLFVASFAGLLYSDGAKMGLDDVAFAEIALQRKNSGKALGQQELARCYHPKKGFTTMAAGVLPFFAAALALALIATKQVYRLGSLPSWITGFERRADIELALGYYHQLPDIGLQEILRVVVRLMLFPYVNILGTESSAALLWLERLGPLLVLIIPMGYPLGYLRGRHMRAGVHGAIAANTRRRAVRERKERKRRTKQNNPLV